MAATRQIFISYARKDGEDFARELSQRLVKEKLDLPPWMDREQMEGGKGWWKQIEKAIDSSKFLVLVMTPAALVSDTTRKEWRYARQQGVIVYPVKGVPDSQLDYDDLPAWMSKSHFFDLTREWETFVRYLRSDREVPRVPFMAPDTRKEFVPRAGQYGELLGLLLDERRKNPVAITTALQGAGGYGKTTLATMLCHDDRVIDAFDDGVLWATLGEDANQGTVLRELGKLYYAITREQPSFVDTSQASIELAQKLENLRCLLVIDDVWKEELLEPFLRGGKGCTRLVTTRLFPVARACGERSVKVDQMTPEESARMLLQNVPELEHPSDLTSFRDLAARLGKWPLLLKLASGALRGKLDRGESLAGALDYLNCALNRHGIFAFDAKNSGQRAAAVVNTIEISTGLLDSHDLTRFFELAIFPEDTLVPITTLGRLWSQDELDAEDTAQRLADHSLLDIDLKQGVVFLHDVMRAYIASKLPNPTEVHCRLISAWGDFLRLPDEYAWRWAIHHLSKAGLVTEIQRLLFDFDWLLAKLEATDANALITDFDSQPNDPDVMLLQRAIQLSVHVLGRDPCQLASQLTGRLLGIQKPNIQALMARIADWRGANWMRALQPNLLSPEGSLFRILDVHGGDAVAVTADGQRAVSASLDDNTVRVWDLESGKALFSLEGHFGGITSIAITPDGGRVISASHDHTLRVWDLESGKSLLSLKGHSDKVDVVVVTPDGRRAISASHDRALRVWDLKSGRSRLLSLKGHSKVVNAMVVTPDGRCAISASDDKTLRVWNLTSRKRLLSLKGHSKKVNAVVVTPNGKHVVSASDDNTLRIWELESGKTIFSLEGHSAGVTAVALTPDGRRAVSASHDGTLRVWDLESGKSILSLDGHSLCVSAVVVTMDGRRAISASWDSTLRIWDLENGQSILSLKGHSGWVTAVAVTMDGRRAISTSDDNTLVWNLESGKTPFSPEKHSHCVTAVAVTSDGQRAVSASYDNTLRVWELATGKALLSLEGRSQAAHVVALTPDGQRAVCDWNDNSLRVWDLASGKNLFSLNGHSDSIIALALTLDGKRAVSASEDKTLRVWDLETGQNLLSLSGRSDYLASFALTPDGGHLISSSDENVLLVRDLKSGKKLLSLKGHTDSILAVAVTPDGRHAISASNDKTLRVWDLERGKALFALEGHSNGVIDVAVTPDGQRAVSAADDMTLRVWDLASGRSIHTLEGHSNWVPAVSVTPDGQRVISASDDKTVRVWDLESGKEICVFWVDAPVWCCTSNFDGSVIVAGDRGGRVHFLRLVEAENGPNSQMAPKVLRIAAINDTIGERQ